MMLNPLLPTPCTCMDSEVFRSLSRLVKPFIPWLMHPQVAWHAVFIAAQTAVGAETASGDDYLDDIHCKFGP